MSNKIIDSAFLLLLLGIVCCLEGMIKERSKEKKREAGREAAKEEVLNIIQQDAYKKMRYSSLGSFDALVGDTSCQIRALKILFLYEQLMHGKDLSEKDQKFMVLSRLLTITKQIQPDGSELTNNDLLKENDAIKQLNLTKKTLGIIVNEAKEQLSQLSVEFMQEEAQKMGDVELINALAPQGVYTNQAPRVSVCGCFPNFKVILFQAVHNNIPLIIKINRMCGDQKAQTVSLFYKYSIDSDNFIESEIQQDDLSKPCIVLEGYNRASQNCLLNEQEFFEQYRKHSVTDIILASTACHSQFLSNPKSMAFEAEYKKECLGKNLFQEIECFQKIAHEYGYCKANPAVFCLDHVYCNLVKYVK